LSTLPPLPESGSFAITSREEAAAVRLQLLAGTRYKLAIHLPALPPEALGNPLELAELRRIATSGRGAEIRLILGDPNAALRMGHRLIDLAQRLSTAFQIRMPCEDETSEATSSSAWLLNDTGGYLFLPDAERPDGRAALRDGPGQAPLLLQFERIWERAEPATQLQSLGL
jgi:hypothetical protein